MELQKIVYFVSLAIKLHIFVSMKLRFLLLIHYFRHSILFTVVHYIFLWVLKWRPVDLHSYRQVSSSYRNNLSWQRFYQPQPWWLHNRLEVIWAYVRFFIHFLYNLLTLYEAIMRHFGLCHFRWPKDSQCPKFRHYKGKMILVLWDDRYGCLVNVE